MTDSPKVTAEDMAERIADIIWRLPGGVDIRRKGVNLIAAAINSAEDSARAEGFADALGRAAHFVETYREEAVGPLKTYYAEDRILADRIRALKPQSEKKGAE